MTCEHQLRPCHQEAVYVVTTYRASGASVRQRLCSVHTTSLSNIGWPMSIEPLPLARKHESPVPVPASARATEPK